MYEQQERDHYGVHVTVSQARDDFAELVNRAAYKQERVIISRRGRAVAAIVPIEDVAYLERLEDEYDLKMAERAAAEGGDSVPWEDIKQQFGLEPR
jgi:prevent-host-death family protein